ncbi:MAG: hypothetical protein EON93_24960 [Burkholderiales bacterium]|nr:MAG: hypothetical protein EON93_24960 [Burkholderiales bacterium]
MLSPPGASITAPTALSCRLMWIPARISAERSITSTAFPAPKSMIRAGIHISLHDSAVGAVIDAPGGDSITLIGVDPHDLHATGTGYIFDGN